MAALLRSAAIHNRAPMGSPSSTVVSDATSRIFTPSTGVATETSPVFKASRLKTCPTTKSSVTNAGCHQSCDEGIVPPSSQSGANTSADA